jgi:hypothetical protein
LNFAAQDPKSTKASAIERWIVPATIVLSAAIAWMHIRSESIWYDESITLLVTAGHSTLGADGLLDISVFRPTANLATIVAQLYQHDVHPPLYFCALALWRVALGPSLEVARAFSALFMLGTLWLLYRYAGWGALRWPSVPTIIYALSAAGMRYAYNARPYAMAAFLITLTLLLSQRKSRWTGVCAAACVATHYFAALCVGPIVVIDCLIRWKSDRRWSLLTALSFLICCAPLLFLVTRHFGARPQQFAGFGPLSAEVWAMLIGCLKAAMPPFRLGYKFTLLIAAAFTVAGVAWTVRRKQITVPLAFVAFLCGFLLIAIASHKSIVRMPQEYYLGISAPLSVLLIAYGATAYPLASPLLVLVLVSGTVAPAPLPFSEEWRGIISRIRPGCDHCAILVGAGAGRGVPGCVLYEAKGIDVYVLTPSSDLQKVMDQIGKGRTIYLIPSRENQTAEVEQNVAKAFSAVRKDGYYVIQPTTK